LDLIAWIDDNVGKEFRTKFGQSIEFDRHFLEKYFKTNTASSSSLKDRRVKKQQSKRASKAQIA
jgi:transposase